MPRRTKYEDSFAKQAYKLCLLGATDEELADFFEVSRVTIHSWKRRQERFASALQKGKAVADSTVARSLFQRACGYRHKAVKIIPYAGKVAKVDYIEHYPPDTTACIFWLKNRAPEHWRDNPDQQDERSADRLNELAEAIYGPVASGTNDSTVQ